MRLLSVEPMLSKMIDGEPTEDNDEQQEEGPCKSPLKRYTKFGAAAMASQIKRVMKSFGEDLDNEEEERLKCIISDNNQCNHNLAVLLFLCFYDEGYRGGKACAKEVQGIIQGCIMPQPTYNTVSDAPGGHEVVK